MQNELKKNYRVSYQQEKEKFGFEQDNKDKIDGKSSSNYNYDSTWYKEVIELRKKACEYKVDRPHLPFSPIFFSILTSPPQTRAWSSETNRDLFNKQVELWNQVSRRSSLSALSLASSVRPITKEEKDKENTKKSSPTKAARIPGSARLVDNRTVTDGNLYGRLRRETIRHHLERTTGHGKFEIIVC